MDINIGKTDRTMTVDLVKLFARTNNPDEFIRMIDRDPVASYVVRYGLTQALNDSHSSITAKSDPDATVRGDKAWNLAAKKLDALYAGELRAERVTKPKDTAGQIAIELAMDVLRGVHGRRSPNWIAPRSRHGARTTLRAIQRLWRRRNRSRRGAQNSRPVQTSRLILTR
jgi:hypothetical protein